jgi:3-oxoadipate enol-lactonase
MLLPLKGRNIHYDLAGTEGGPVVCFGHSLASDGGMWAEQLAPLVHAGWRVLRVDMRGHGGSDAAPGDYHMDELAEDMATVLEALAITPVHYIGLSIGGMYAQPLALKHGAKLKSMMLCDTSAASPPGAKETWPPRIAAVQQAKSTEPVADGTMERWFTPAFKTKNPGRWKQIRDTIVGTKPEGFIGCASAIVSFDYLARLPQIKVPTLVVCGAGDPGTPPEGNKRIAAGIPGARYEEIANAQHFPNVERPEAFNKIMMGWLWTQR